MIYDNDFYKQEIRKHLGDARYIHSLNVADSALYLAKKYGEDTEKAYTAGLLHDILKEMPKTEMREYIMSHYELTVLEQLTPNVWHQIADAIFVKENYLEDEDIINAIHYHTTGRAGMSKLEKIVYVADFISAERNYPDVDIMRGEAEKSLEEAMLYSLKYTINKLLNLGCPIHPDTVAAYNEITSSERK